jgi:two-component system, NarL family, invasion response regulator UvrY
MKLILIVDDHTILRQGVLRILKEILDQQMDFHEACDGQQALAMISLCSYDLVLLDISLPDMNGLNVLKLLQQRNPKLPVVILSTHLEEHYAVRSLRAGAAGYVNKGSDASVLKEAIEKALSGRKFVTPAQSELLVGAISDRRDSGLLPEALSDREYELICMMTAGKTLTEIAAKLSLSVKTISTYRARVLEKLQLRTTADLISYGTHHKLAEYRFPT